MRLLTRPPRRNVRRNLAITLLLLAAAVPVGLAVNWLAADLANGRAWLVLVLAVAVAAMAELFRYVGVQG